MSYTPTQWVDGDVITAEKLNNIESGINGVDYKSTDNLKTIFNGSISIPSGSSGEFDYNDLINYEEIIVILNAREYVCQRTCSLNKYTYLASNSDPVNGGVFSKIESIVDFDSVSNNLYVSQTGTYYLEIKVKEKEYIINDGFKGTFDQALGYKTKPYVYTFFTNDFALDPMAAAFLEYREFIYRPEGLNIIYDGTEYTLPFNMSSETVYIYGEFDLEGPIFTTYPLMITSVFNEESRKALTGINTLNGGEHTIEIPDILVQSVEPNFKGLINNIILQVEVEQLDAHTFVSSKTYEEIEDFYNNGGFIYIKFSNNFYYLDSYYPPSGGYGSFRFKRVSFEGVEDGYALTEARVTISSDGTINTSYTQKEFSI